MFNDFKNKVYSATSQKIRTLKNIYDRLRLPDLEERLLKLERSLGLTYQKTNSLPPSRTIVTTSGKIYLIVHLHNPEGIEINSLISNFTFIGGIPSDARVEITGYGTILGASTLSQHGEQHDLTLFMQSYFSTYGHRNVTLNGIFNGIYVNQTYNLLPGTTTEVYFQFPRIDMAFDYATSSTQSIDITTGPLGNGNYQLAPLPYQKPWHLQGRSIAPAPTTPNIIIGNTIGNYNISKTNFSADILTTKTVYGWIVSGYYGTTLANPPYLPNIVDIMVPSQPFTQWFSQGEGVGLYPFLHIYNNSFQGGTIFNSNISSPLTVFSRPANLSYTKLLIEPNDSYWLISEVYSGINTNHEYWNGAILNDGLKVSSVPYDLDNTGF